MAKLQTPGILCVLAMVVALPLAASAQQEPTAPAPSAAPEKIAPPKTEPGPDAMAPSTKPPAVNPSETPAAQTAKDLVGLDVFSSDGTRIGEVRSVNTGPSGDIVALRIRTGGFLGFGGRIVAIPQGKFIRAGQSIRLDLASDEVTGLPEVKD